MDNEVIFIKNKYCNHLSLSLYGSVYCGTTHVDPLRTSSVSVEGNIKLYLKLVGGKQGKKNLHSKYTPICRNIFAFLMIFWVHPYGSQHTWMDKMVIYFFAIGKKSAFCDIGLPTNILYLLGIWAI